VEQRLPVGRKGQGVPQSRGARAFGSRDSKTLVRVSIMTKSTRTVDMGGDLCDNEHTVNGLCSLSREAGPHRQPQLNPVTMATPV
jgi:hypothetical protein